jgi:hypothetical protein
MTTFASGVFNFIKYKRILIPGDRFVAFKTGNVLMTAIQFEGGFTMIKGKNFPLVSQVASQAICYSIGFKLVKMYIRVACNTG